MPKYLDLKKIVIDPDGPYSVDKNYDEPMTDGTMTSACYPLGKGVTLILVAEGWTADAKIDDALAYITGVSNDGEPQPIADDLQVVCHVSE